MDPIEQKLLEKLLKLPQVPKALGSYIPVQKSGKTLWLSGQLPIQDGTLKSFKGRLGKEISVDAGARAAQQCTLNALAQIKQELGRLDKIAKVVKLTGYVSSIPGFTSQAQVLNGASDLLVELYGEAGRHARVAVGVIDLPLGACVEIEYIFEMK